MKILCNGHFVKYLFLTVLLFFDPFNIMSGAAEEKAHDTIVPLPVSGDRLTLIDAAYLAIAHNTEIHLHKETVQELRGSVMNAGGQFDTSFILNLKGSFIQEELSPSEWQGEWMKREILRALSEGFNRIAEGEDPSDDIEIILDDILVDIQPTNEEEEYELDNICDGLFEWCDEDIQDETALFRCLADRTQNNLEAIGSIPKASQNISYSFEVGLSKQFRNGVVLAPRIVLEQENRQYRGKPRSKAKGGTDKIEAWNSTIGIVIKVPIGKGWGVGSTGANEKASLINHEAGLAHLRHTVSASVYNVILAYWDVVAAQESFRFWKDSARLQIRLVGLCQALIEAGEMPRTDLNRVKARAAYVTAALINAKRAVKETRLRLAEVIGLDVNDISQAPQASDPFPEPADLSALRSTEPFRLVEQAVKGRQDYLATLELQDSAKVLMNAARLDLKRKKDLELSIDYGGRDWDASVGNGVGGALYEKLTGPSIMLTFTMDWPFNNNTAKGDLVQKRALWRKTIITANDLKRNIASNVVELQRTIQKRSHQVHMGMDSVRFYTETLEGSLERFRSREITLTDTLLTEERLTNAMLDLVNAKQDYAKTLAGLRFETGTLLSYSDEGLRVDKDTLFSIPSI